MTPGNVVLSITDISEAEFRSAVTLGLSRAERSLGGLRQLAAVMDVSTRQLQNIMKGGSTDPKRLFDVEKAAPDTLRELMALYGFQLSRPSAPAPRFARCWPKWSKQKPMASWTTANCWIWSPRCAPSKRSWTRSWPRSTGCAALLSWGAAA